MKLLIFSYFPSCFSDFSARQEYGKTYINKPLPYTEKSLHLFLTVGYAMTVHLRRSRPPKFRILKIEPRLCRDQIFSRHDPPKRVEALVGKGASIREAAKAVAEETGKTPSAVRQTFAREREKLAPEDAPSALPGPSGKLCRL
jgi:hypothetical protein